MLSQIHHVLINLALTFWNMNKIYFVSNEPDNICDKYDEDSKSVQMFCFYEWYCENYPKMANFLKLIHINVHVLLL